MFATVYFQVSILNENFQRNMENSDQNCREQINFVKQVWYCIEKKKNRHTVIFTYSPTHKWFNIFFPVKEHLKELNLLSAHHKEKLLTVQSDLQVEKQKLDELNLQIQQEHSVRHLELEALRLSLTNMHAAHLELSQANLQKEKETALVQLREALNDKRAQELAILQGRHQFDLQQLQNHHSKEMDSVLTQHSEKVEQLQGDYSHETSQLKAEHAHEIKQLQEARSLEMTSSDRASEEVLFFWSQLDSNRASRQELNELKEQLLARAAQVDEIKRLKQEFEDQKLQMKTEHEQVMEELRIYFEQKSRVTEESFREELEILHQRLQQMSDDEREEMTSIRLYSKKFVCLRFFCLQYNIHFFFLFFFFFLGRQEELSYLRLQSEEQDKRHLDDLQSTLMLQYKEDVLNMKMELSDQYISQIEAIKKKHSLELEQLRARLSEEHIREPQRWHETKLGSSASKHNIQHADDADSRVSELQSRYAEDLNTHITKLQGQHQEELRARESELLRQHQEALNARVLEQQSQHQEDLIALVSEYETQIQNLEMMNSAKLDNLETSYIAEIQKIRDEHALALADLDICLAERLKEKEKEMQDRLARAEQQWLEEHEQKLQQARELLRKELAAVYIENYQAMTRELEIAHMVRTIRLTSILYYLLFNLKVLKKTHVMISFLTFFSIFQYFKLQERMSALTSVKETSESQLEVLVQRRDRENQESDNLVAMLRSDTQSSQQELSRNQETAQVVNQNQDLLKRMIEETEAKNTLQVELHKAQGLIEGYMAEKAALEETLSKKESGERNLIMELEKSQEQLKIVSKEPAVSTEQRELLLRLQEILSGNVKDVEVELLKETERLAKEKLEFQCQAQKDQSNLLSQMKVLEMELEEQMSTNQELVKKTNDMPDLKQQIQSLEKQLKNQRHFMDEQAVEREHERDDFQQEIQKLEEQLKQAFKNQGDFRAYGVRATFNHSTLPELTQNSEMEELNSLIEHLRSDQERLRQDKEVEVEQLHEVIEKLQRELEQLGPNRHEVSDSQESLDQLGLGEVVNLQKIGRGVQQSHASCEKDRDFLRKQLSSLREENELLRIQDLMRERDTSLVEKDLLVQTLQEQRTADILEMENQLAQRSFLLEEQAAELQELQESNASLHERLEKFSVDYSDKENKYKEEIQDLREQLGKYDIRRITLNSCIVWAVLYMCVFIKFTVFVNFSFIYFCVQQSMAESQSHSQCHETEVQNLQEDRLNNLYDLSAFAKPRSFTDSLTDMSAWDSPDMVRKQEEQNHSLRVFTPFSDISIERTNEHNLKSSVLLTQPAQHVRLESSTPSLTGSNYSIPLSDTQRSSLVKPHFCFFVKQKRIVLEHLLASDRSSLLSEIQDLRSQLRMAHLQNQEKLQQLQESLTNAEERGSTKEHHMRRQVELLEYKLQQETSISEDLKASLNHERDIASEQHRLLLIEQASVSQLRTEQEEIQELSTSLDEQRTQNNKLSAALSQEQSCTNNLRRELQIEQSRFEALLSQEHSKLKQTENELEKVKQHSLSLSNTLTHEKSTVEQLKHEHARELFKRDQEKQQEHNLALDLQSQLKEERSRARELVVMVEKTQHQAVSAKRQMESEVQSSREEAQRERELSIKLRATLESVQCQKQQLDNSIVLHRERETKLPSSVMDVLRSENEELSKSVTLLTNEKLELRSQLAQLQYRLQQGPQRKVQRIYRKFLRAESFRKALVYQKKYLLLLLGGFQACEKATLSLIARMGVYPTPADVQVPTSHKPGLTKFRSAVRVVIAISRLKFLVKKWNKIYKKSSNGEAGIQSSNFDSLKVTRHVLAVRLHMSICILCFYRSANSSILTQRRLQGPSPVPEHSLTEYIKHLEMVQQRLGGLMFYPGSCNRKQKEKNSLRRSAGFTI
uniref:Pericentrin/AKAP-450 centrosomal targeting domain-containing protein n=1 Tax=Leptobrachium leishanense TaxID=445787 RepID=A0A8C5Q5F6_9ANUR